MRSAAICLLRVDASITWPYLSARLHGWQTRTFTEKVCLHHRQMGTAMQGALKAKFKLGVKDYTVGNHPLWELARAVYQMKNRPLVIGGLALGSGYAWSLVRRAETPLSADLVALVRREQMDRLKKLFGRKPQATAGRVAGTSGSQLS